MFRDVAVLCTSGKFAKRYRFYILLFADHMGRFTRFGTLCKKFFKKVKNTHGGVILLVKLQAKAYSFTNSNTPPWAFLTFFQFYKWHQMVYLTVFCLIRYYLNGPSIMSILRNKKKSSINYLNTFISNTCKFLWSLLISLTACSRYSKALALSLIINFRDLAWILLTRLFGFREPNIQIKSST